MHAVDTNVLLRLLTQDDPRQTTAASGFVAPGAWISTLVLAEVAWVLAAVYERSATEIATAVDMLLDHRTLVVQDPDVVIGALKLFRERPALGFSDCLIFQLASKAGHLPLGTFDRDLGKVPGTRKL